MIFNQFGNKGIRRVDCFKSKKMTELIGKRLILVSFFGLFSLN